MNFKSFDNPKICIIGLGYVGLPLAVEFGRHFSVVGFDLNQNRINELELGLDSTLEVSKEELASSKGLVFSSYPEDIKSCNIFIVCVPTPINEKMKPDLTPIMEASKLIGKSISNNNIVVYESTVFPGATEEICVPLIENISGLTHNHEFFSGYSPERINPGDKKHRISDIVKVTSGSTEEVAEFIDSIYKKIISAGTFKASSIKVAEAAKVIENTQRDVNIALINELALIFDRLDLDTNEVLEAAKTKWNFLPFMPGLVGGHCIGVDPYYLTFKAEQVGYKPEIILAGRRINNNMSKFVANKLSKELDSRNFPKSKLKTLVMGITFKENCPDLRNTKVIDVINELKKLSIEVNVFDPWCSQEEAKKEYGIELLSDIEENTYDSIILAVSHQEIIDMGIEKIRSFCKKDSVIFDLKNMFKKEDVDIRL